MPLVHTIYRLTDDFLLTVYLTREFRIRRWIAVRLMCLAAWVLGCDIEIKDSD